MVDEIVVPLDDARAKHISEVLGNKSCLKILDYLAEKAATVSDVSRDLKIPLNTADYNVKKLVKAGLIEKDSYFWSVKGRKMPSYRVSNKRIVISPKRRNIGTFLWTLALTGLCALTIRQFFGRKEIIEAGSIASDEAVLGAAKDAFIAPQMESFAVNAGASDAAIRAVSDSGFWSSVSSWEWFLIGAWVAIALFFVLTLVNERRKYER